MATSVLKEYAMFRTGKSVKLKLAIPIFYQYFTRAEAGNISTGSIRGPAEFFPEFNKNTVDSIFEIGAVEPSPSVSDIDFEHSYVAPAIRYNTDTGSVIVPTDAWLGISPVQTADGSRSIYLSVFIDDTPYDDEAPVKPVATQLWEDYSIVNCFVKIYIDDDDITPYAYSYTFPWTEAAEEVGFAWPNASAAQNIYKRSILYEYGIESVYSRDSDYLGDITNARIIPQLVSVDKNSEYDFQVELVNDADGHSEIAKNVLWFISDKPELPIDSPNIEGVSIDQNGHLTVEEPTVESFFIFARTSDRDAYLQLAVKGNSPYGGGGVTGPGQMGGDGTYNPGGNDAIVAPDGSAEGPDGAGLYTRYLVSPNTMHVFGDWLWTEDLGLTIAKAAVGLIYGSPADTLISLVSYPFSVGSIAGTGSAEVKWGGFATGITWPTLASNAGSIDWGSINIAEYWKNFLDYSPHTKIELYLPWGTGFVDVDVNQVMGGSISVRTNIEFAKGTCVHLVYNHQGSLIGSYSATVGKSLPITASDFASKQVAVAGSAIGLAVGATIAGASALNAGVEAAGGVTYHTVTNQYGQTRQYPVISGFSMDAARGEFTRTLPNAARPALQAAAAAAKMPASYHRSGSFQEGSAGLCVQYPFIIISRPKQSVPVNYGHYYGYPCNKVLSLGSCSGYTEVGEVHLDGVPATDSELIEIDRLLKGGVLL